MSFGIGCQASDIEHWALPLGSSPGVDDRRHRWAWMSGVVVGRWVSGVVVATVVIALSLGMR